jgi:GT2 family glycosyltransferase
VNTPKVCVVIVTYNGKQWIEDCLASILSSKHKLDLVVVDNGSNDGTTECIKKAISDCHLVRLRSNLGFGQANNIGIGIAIDIVGADYVFLLNQDARLLPETIGKLVAIAEKEKGLAIISPVHLNWEGSAMDPWTASYFAPYALDIIDDFRRGQVADFYKVHYMPAAAWLVRTEVFNQIGGFDPLFRHRGEDEDFSRRLSWWGSGFVLAMKAYICHAHFGARSGRTVRSAFSERRNRSLLTLKDLNRGLPANFMIELGEIGGRVMLYLASGHILSLGAELLAIIPLFFLLPGVIKSRQLCRKGGRLWIPGSGEYYTQG